MPEPKKEKITVLKSETVNSNEGATHYYRYAKIKTNGDLEVGSNDSGAAPEGMLGGDSESWVEVSANVKDDLLLALLQLSFNGQYSPEDALAEFLKKNNIPFNMRSEVW